MLSSLEMRCTLTFPIWVALLGKTLYFLSDFSINPGVFIVLRQTEDIELLDIFRKAFDPAVMKLQVPKRE